MPDWHLATHALAQLRRELTAMGLHDKYDAVLRDMQHDVQQSHTTHLGQAAAPYPSPHERP